MQTSARKLLQDRMKDLYDVPPEFWRRFLDRNLNFHLGHFKTPSTTLSQAMRGAVENLARHSHLRAHARVLDIGCGWGGPAFVLATKWQCKTTGLTISQEQATYINRKFEQLDGRVRARVIDADTHDFVEAVSYDTLWLYEVLEHIVDRPKLLGTLAQKSRRGTTLSIAVTCRSEESGKVDSDILGVQPLDTAQVILKLIETTGWNVVYVADHTANTLPVWQLWCRQLERIVDSRWRALALKLRGEFEILEQLYASGQLCSIQIVATHGQGPRFD